ncbi:hypothetical protein CP8484711_1880A, partial [Chlamydia psittaci 84-8471/1]
MQSELKDVMFPALLHELY